MTEPVAVRAADSTDCDQIWPLACDLATSFVAQRSRGLVVGYLLAFVHPSFFANGPVGWVEELLVADDVRREGMGRKLMLAAEEWSTAAGAAYLSLTTQDLFDFVWNLARTPPDRAYRDSSRRGGPAP